MNKPSISTPPIHRRFRGALLPVFFGSLLAGTSVQANPVATPAPVIIIQPKPQMRVTVDPRPENTLIANQAILDLRAPNNPANLMEGSMTTQILDGLRRMQGHGATAGAESGKEVKESKEAAPEAPQWTVYGEYSYLNSESHRDLGDDSHDHTATGGVNLTLNKTLLGLTYQYTHETMASPMINSNNHSDTNNVGLSATQTLTDFLAVGVMGSYGHSEVDTFAHDPFFNTLATDYRTNTYMASPYVTLSYSSGNFYASLMTAYAYQHTQSFGSDQLSVTLTGGYQFTSWLTGEFMGNFTQSLHNTQQGPAEDDNWFKFGPKLMEYINPRLYIYEAYECGLNNTYSQHTVTGGISYSF